jgi:hypothetical protein
MTGELNLAKTLERIFPVLKTEKRSLVILVDVPFKTPDNEGWRVRRELAIGWFQQLSSSLNGLAEVMLAAYPDVGSNNGNLPENFFLVSEGKMVHEISRMESGTPISSDQLFRRGRIFLAPTEHSTTAPLKVLARSYGFRAATMPGFSSGMLSACELDYSEVYRRTRVLKDLLVRAEHAFFEFLTDGRDTYALRLDLRFRSAHISAGVFTEAGSVGNFPSGETYIVPYEGELGEASASSGILPVQLENELLLYEVAGNRAVAVRGEGPQFEKEKRFLELEPAYGNISELGLGVLSDFGIAPIGEILLDEKLGLHIAFGRSDHFGGAVGPSQFRDPANVIHLDRIFIRELQPRIDIVKVTLAMKTGDQAILIRDNLYQVFNQILPVP